MEVISVNRLKSHSSLEIRSILLQGNGYTLVYRSPQPIQEGVRNSVAIAFVPGQWHQLDGRLATREEIMMALANVEHLLVKLQYIDQVQRDTELLNIVMDSAAIRDFGLGSASLIEECRCPVGYSGLSCENCDHGYVRQQTGSWLGRCVREEEPCRPGTYGDPRRGVACKPCPCPGTDSGSSFARTCYLGPDNDVVCNCERGYKGRRCEECADGFVGNPLLPNGSCRLYIPPTPSHCDPRGTLRTHDSHCECKEHVTGERCDQCKSHSFSLNPRSVSGCIDCFCSGVSRDCKSSSWFRDSVHATFVPSRNEFSLVVDYENPEEVEQDLLTQNNEVSFEGVAGDPNVYFWRLPSRFAGNKITSYGGNLNYTIRYVPTPGGIMSRNNAPDVVIRSLNDITILHYRRDEVSPSGSQEYTVPITEDHWQRTDGNRINRQHLLMALADVSDVFIKATYTTTTEEAALSAVSLDTANAYNTGSYVRADEVEQCICPRGHQGLSCEDCAPGYTRSEHEGLYLGLCEPCNCNGHSDECDPETGVCHNCRDNTEGDHCQYCAPGFNGNATRGSPSDCGSLEPPSPSTNCRTNVIGRMCDQCRDGSYNLDDANPLGCTECFCSGTTTQCTASRFYRDQIPMLIFEDKFPLVNRIGEIQTNEEPIIDWATNQIKHPIHDGNSYYWSLPRRFLGNQLNSYGGYLNFTISNNAYGGYMPEQDVIIRGNGITLFWVRGNPDEGFTTARLKETEWQSSDLTTGARIASRGELMTVLSNLESILVRATLKEGVSEVALSDVALDTAVPQNTGQGPVRDVEICRCPEGYTGTSCEVSTHEEKVFSIYNSI